MKNFLKKYGIYLLPFVFLFIASFFIFFILRTCITFWQFLELFLFVSAAMFALYFILAKKYSLFIFDFINFIIIILIVPLFISLFLALNFMVSTPVYKERVPIRGHIVRNDKLGVVIVYKNRPDVCPKLFKVQEGIDLDVTKEIETEIHKGLFGLFILKHQKTY